MRHLFGNLFRTGAIGMLAVLILFGCANVNQKIQDLNVSQKYEDSKSWFKDKWQAVGSKFSSSKEEEPSIKADEHYSKFLVYQTRWSFETLSGIAAWFTKDAGNWKALATANPKVKPNRIAVGTKIKIPSQLAKTQKLPPESFAAQHRPYHFEHRVRWSGETLSLIAKWYTGRIANWKALARANPGLNPNRIIAGNIIYIPPELLKTKKRLPRKVVAKTLPGYFTHMVTEPEEKLSDIARWYTGDTKNAKALAKANPDIDPEFLLVGNEIFIPVGLLKTRKPFGQKSVRASAPKPANKPAARQADSPASKPKKIQLFGPKQFPEHE